MYSCTIEVGNPSVHSYYLYLILLLIRLFGSYIANHRPDGRVMNVEHNGFVRYPLRV